MSEMEKNPQKPNHLIDEKSPYLQQHAYNPVNWYPWGEEAFHKAVEEDKPIFLSIGYSTCHWCHVMEKESFEDDEVAESMNRNFIAIKVDREERPDIDHIYMTVCQALTGRGGWPLTILMTPDKKPFFAGTYFPKQSTMGMHGMLQILDFIGETWAKNRDALLESSEKIMGALDGFDKNQSRVLNADILRTAYSGFASDFDSLFGGFGNAPKFPSPQNLFFLLRYWSQSKETHALEMVEKTLDSMYRGGIYDHVGFGFSRYSSDRKWLVPHFEKMLYDNALLAIAYLETYQATGKVKYLDIARQIFTYVLRDMRSEEGGFYSAEDADSEGEEGRFYLWTVQEIVSILGERAGKEFCSLYDLSAIGNFEGKNIPNLIKASQGSAGLASAEQETIRQSIEKLNRARTDRIHPYKDDKILTAWNGLMIAALAIGGRIAENPEYTIAAEKAASFILEKMIRKDGRLLARYRQGEAAYPAYLEDYAFLIWGLIELYETTYKPEYLKKAVLLNEDLIRYFWDADQGGFYLYGSDGEQLIARPKTIYDGATPSGNSMAAMNLVRLSRLTGRFDLEEKAEQLLRAFGGNVHTYSQGHAQYLIALLYMQSESKEVIFVEAGDHSITQKMIRTLHKEFRPFASSLLISEAAQDITEIAPFTAHYAPINGKTAAYVCRKFSCLAPVTDPDAFKRKLEE